LIVDDAERRYYLKYFLENNLLTNWVLNTLSAHVPKAHGYTKAVILKKLSEANFNNDFSI